MRVLDGLVDLSRINLTSVFVLYNSGYLSSQCQLLSRCFAWTALGTQSVESETCTYMALVEEIEPSASFMPMPSSRCQYCQVHRTDSCNDF